MKKFLNSPQTMLDESFDGFVAAHSDIVIGGEERKFVRRRTLTPGKVGLVSGGGSGHEPLHAGFVGLGMLDAACPGQIFTSPTPDQMLAAVEAVDQGGGVVLIVKNYEGDVMNFEMAAEVSDGRCVTVLTDDDVAVESSTYSTGRRGVAGTLIVEKLVGAAAQAGMKRSELQALGQGVNRRTRSMGVALTSCTVPAAGKPNFELGDNEIEMGVGIHGEPGRRRVALASAHALVEEMVNAILVDLAPRRGSEAILFVNGFGGTPLIELYLLYHEAARIIDAAGLKPARSLVGSFVTSLDMAGASITVSLLDDGAARLWDAPVHTAALRWGV
ncbi:MAG: dihydroxyacetone kinase subunit DhaK [Hyphomicrobiales bacterium]|nr:dihydroxyacetone kinase subunit DhaK [Hyphomicrobiales bacterium]MBV8441015.1 dihydroxyacetone kinase subunit DhaK [Hyphomicrobiales bacterium]